MPDNSYAELSMCAERLRLSSVVAKAIRANFDARDARDNAVKDKNPIAPFTASLTEAREAENAAIKALHMHRREHGC